MAFTVSGAFVLGDHLAFTAGFKPAMIVGKQTAGILAVFAALFFTRRNKYV